MPAEFVKRRFGEKPRIAKKKTQTQDIISVSVYEIHSQSFGPYEATCYLVRTCSMRHAVELTPESYSVEARFLI